MSGTALGTESVENSKLVRQGEQSQRANSLQKHDIDFGCSFAYGYILLGLGPLRFIIKEYLAMLAPFHQLAPSPLTCFLAKHMIDLHRSFESVVDDGEKGHSVATWQLLFMFLPPDCQLGKYLSK